MLGRMLIAAAGSGAPATLVIFMGQSNASGFSSDPQNTTSIPNGYAYEFAEENAILPLGVTRIGITQGSAMTAWCKGWVGGGGAPSIVVNCSVGGASMTKGAMGSGGTFDLSHTPNHYVATMKTRITKAIAAAVAHGFRIVHKHVVWIQGEQDAHAYGVTANGGTANDTAYRANLNALIDLVQADFGIDAWFVSELGTSNPSYPSVPATDDGNNPEVADYLLIRAAQANVVADKAIAHMVYTDAKTFARRGLLCDSEHYAQAGYDELGTIGSAAALAAVGGQSYPAPGLSKFTTIAAMTPQITGFKRCIITTTASGAINPQIYFSPVSPNYSTWKDCSGQNRQQAVQSLNWTFTAGIKTIVLYVSDSASGVTLTAGSGLNATSMLWDAGLRIATFSCGDCPNLTIGASEFQNLYDSVDMFLGFPGSQVSITDAILGYLPTLKTLIIDNTPSTFTTLAANPLVTRLDAQNIGANTSRINSILQSLDANGLSNGLTQLSQTPSAPPSGAGATAKTNLQGRGWTVSTN